jgi:hypothetical protein
MRRLKAKGGRSSHRAAPSSDYLKKQRRLVVSKVARLGFHIEHLHGQKKARDGGQRRKLVKINGKTCAIRVLSNIYSQPQRRKIFARTLVYLYSLEDTDFQIIRIAGLGSGNFTLVVPSTDLRNAIFGGRHRREAQIYVPLGERPETPIFDFEPFEEAWHLLENGTKRRQG